jgi:hypothetical protein
VRDVLSERDPEALPVPLFVDTLLPLTVLDTIADFDIAGE